MGIAPKAANSRSNGTLASIASEFICIVSPILHVTRVLKKQLSIFATRSDVFSIDQVAGF
jgi:hypothetical protein